jgi:hypothetical protein
MIEAGLIVRELNSTGMNLAISMEIYERYRDYVNMMWETFEMLYPSYALRPDGKNAYLKSFSKFCKGMYAKAAGADGEYCEIINDTLREEIRDRTSRGTTQYMKTMKNWLSEGSWFNPDMEKPMGIKMSGYGQKLL